MILFVGLLSAYFGHNLGLVRSTYVKLGISKPLSKAVILQVEEILLRSRFKMDFLSSEDGFFTSLFKFNKII